MATRKGPGSMARPLLRINKSLEPHMERISFNHLDQSLNLELLILPADTF